MTAPLADAVVDWGALLDVVWTSLAGGVGVTAVFAIALYGGVHAMDARRDGAAALAAVYAVTALAAFLAVVACVVFGVIVMTGKD